MDPTYTPETSLCTYNTDEVINGLHSVKLIWNCSNKIITIGLKGHYVMSVNNKVSVQKCENKS
eukprot:scaffold50543_cov47-Attheya_sp.AAC.3